MNIASGDRADGMEGTFEGGCDAEIRARATQAPEEVGIAFGVSGKDACVSGDYSSRNQIVARSAMQTGEPAEAAAQDNTGSADSRTLSEHGSKPIATGGSRNLAAQYSA